MGNSRSLIKKQVNNWTAYSQINYFNNKFVHMLEKQGCKAYFNLANKWGGGYEMSNWKCRRCSYENMGPVKNCNRCNNYHSEERTLEDNPYNDFNDAMVFEDIDQLASVYQNSDEVIWIKDSCNISVQTTDTQASVSLQVGLQLAIALVVSIAIGDSDRGQAVAQDIFQQFNDEQTNKQRIYIDNSNDVNVVTIDTDLAVNIQALLQVLVSLVVRLDVL